MKKETKNLIHELYEGSTLACARLMTLVENDDAESHEILKEIFSHAGKANTVGITGPPGVGKSTLTDKLISYARKDKTQVGVVAVDPSSPFSGGALLGDRIRMQAHYKDAGVFIRSMSNRGHLGGLSLKSQNVGKLLEAKGCGWVFYETVGVGQAEVEIAKVALTTLVVLMPGLGDGIQALKAGLLEVADILVINKADKEGAEELQRELEFSIMGLSQEKKEYPKILLTVAAKDEGVENLWEEIKKHRAHLDASGLIHERRKEQIHEELKGLLQDMVYHAFVKQALPDGELGKIVEDIYTKRKDPYTFVSKLSKKIKVEA